MEDIRINNSTDALLYRILEKICFQTSVLDQVLAAQKAQLNILPSLVQAPAQSLSSGTTAPVTNVSQAVSNPNTGPPLGYIATSDYPLPIISLNPIYTVAANTALLYPNSFNTTTTTTVSVALTLDSSATAAYPLITRDNGVTWAALNLATNMIPGAEYQFSILLFNKDVFDISFSAATTIRYLRIAYTYTV